MKPIELTIQINKQAGSEEFYNKSLELGMLAVKSFKGEQERHRSQMTGLENIAETTRKVTDVLDYIKKQTAHQRGDDQGWKKKVGAKSELFGELLKEYIENGLKPFVDTVCNDLDINSTSDPSKQDRQKIYLELVRQCIRQLVVQYEYQIEVKHDK